MKIRKTFAELSLPISVVIFPRLFILIFAVYNGICRVFRKTFRMILQFIVIVTDICSWNLQSIEDHL